MSGQLAATQAGYQRRTQDWELQQALAEDDMNQINAQIAAAQAQEQAAQQDITILEKNIAQEAKVQLLLTSKFSKVELYQWMAGKLAALYFQAYQLSYNLALQAEQAWQFERGVSVSFIKGNYWSSLNHGLLTGETLQLDLQRMEAAYMQQNQRHLEIQKTISLKQLDAKAFSDLTTNGTCTFDLSEKDFDLDYPGHYCRQIKTLSLSFPLVVGPYQNLHVTLTQTANRTLLNDDNGGVDYLLDGGNTQPISSVLRVNLMVNQQIALSQGVNDSGLFMLNFNDARYLPFEGTGAVSSWKLDMPKDNNQGINFDNLTDVILQLHYTALPGTSAFVDHVKQKLK